MANLLSPIRQCSSEMSENVNAAPANNFFTQTYRIEREVDDDENIASRGMMTTLMSFSKLFLCLSFFFPVKVDRAQSRATTTNFPSLPNSSLLKLIYEKI